MRAGQGGFRTQFAASAHRVDAHVVPRLRRSMITVGLRLKLIALGVAAFAVWLGSMIAHEEYTVPLLIGSLAVFGTFSFLLRSSMGKLALGFALFGYFVGNRGFAQITPDSRLPLLPAELVLLIAGGGLVIQSALSRSVPFRSDALNWAVLAWLVGGTARVIFDVRDFGLTALRDYAMVYYAAFFFLAQHIAAEERSRRFLIGVLAFASAAQPLAALLTEIFPDFFLTKFVFRGVPLIYFKGDLVLTFMTVSALLLALFVRPAQRRWAWPLAGLELLYVLGGANRASMLGMFAALAWLAFSTQRRFVLLQAALFAGALFLLCGAALLLENNLAQQKFAGLVERVASLGDLRGVGNYVSDESNMKGDNNRFRTVWWRAVIDETMEVNPAFGLGFGYDLTRNFLREFNPDMAEEFTARSPHSIAVSAFGRMGFAGLAVFLVFCAVLALRTWRAMRKVTTEPHTLGLWACAWVILVSACFGVVLEGPMGAVVFWTLLGLANAAPLAPTASAGAPDTPAPPALLPPAAEPVTVPSHPVSTPFSFTTPPLHP